MGSVNSNHSQGKISTVLIHIWQMGNWGTAWLLISVHSDWSLPLVISGCVTWTLQLQTETTAPSFLVGKMPSMQSVASRQFTGALGELRHGGSRRTSGSWGLHFELWARNRTEWYKTRWVCTGLGLSPASYPWWWCRFSRQQWRNPGRPRPAGLLFWQFNIVTHSAVADRGAPGGGSSHQSLLKKLPCLKHMVCWVPGTSFPTAFGSWNFGIKACYS